MTTHFTSAPAYASAPLKLSLTFNQTVAVAAAAGIPMRQIKIVVSGKWKMQQQQISA